MRFRFAASALALVVILLSVFVLWRWKTRPYDAADLLASLPLQNAVKVYIDADALRSSGLLDLLAGSRASEEPDYRRFVEQSGFDYRRDLDALAASFVDGSIYVSVRGHFAWKRLSAYALAQQGKCWDTLCSMPASQANRYISFYPLTNQVLALAITAQDRGAQDISPPRSQAPAVSPSGPLWASAPGPAFSDLGGLPAGARILSPLADAQEATFSVRPLAPAGDRFEIRLEARYTTPEAARRVAQQFTSTTELLRSMIRREKLTPNPADLSGVLTAGTFEAKGTSALGVWQIEKQFFQSLFSGQGK